MHYTKLFPTWCYCTITFSLNVTWSHKTLLAHFILQRRVSNGIQEAQFWVVMAEIKVTVHVRLYQRKSTCPRAEFIYLQSYVNMDSKFQEQFLSLDMPMLHLRSLLSSCWYWVHWMNFGLRSFYSKQLSNWSSFYFWFNYLSTKSLLLYESLNANSVIYKQIYEIRFKLVNDS